MTLRLLREPSRDGATLGALYVDSVWFCWTLEDVVRDVKIPHETAIPFGVYPVTLSLSARFKIELPEVLNVPGFTGIRIHAGNTNKDTDGCVLVGLGRGHAEIYRSRMALEGLLAQLRSTSAPHRLVIEAA